MHPVHRRRRRPSHAKWGRMRKKRWSYLCLCLSTLEIMEVVRCHQFSQGLTHLPAVS